MEQEKTKSLNTLISNDTSPRRNSCLTSKDENSETPIRSSIKSVSSVGGSSSVRRSSRLLRRVDEKQNETAMRTPQLGAPGGTPYLLRSKSRGIMSLAEENLRRNAVEMPPLNLSAMGDLGGSSEFYRVDAERSGESRECENQGDSSNMYSTPRKRLRGAEVDCVSRNAAGLGVERDLEPGGGSQTRTSSRRKGSGNVKSTPMSKSRRVNEEDSAAKDRKSILKQYDPDGINTATVNIKTPKSQKKVQFGTKNLIIIDENKQDMNIDRLVTESDNGETSRTAGGANNNLGGDLADGRMSILSELDDAGTGQIYNFPSLEELINKRKSDEDGQSSMSYTNNGMDVDISGRKVGEKESGSGVFGKANSSEHFGRRVDSGGDGSGLGAGGSQEEGGGERGRLGSVVQEEDNIEKSLELTDQINMSDYSINYRDSIAPNLPGAFLSVVMKNLSSVNFPEEDGGSSSLGPGLEGGGIQIPELGVGDSDALSAPMEACKTEEESVVKADGERSSQGRKLMEKGLLEGSSKMEREGLVGEMDSLEERQQQVQDDEQQSRQEGVGDGFPESQVSGSGELEAEEKGEEGEDSDHQVVVERFETQQIVLTETLTILKDGNNRLSNILITPRRNNASVGGGGCINRLSPSSESLLKSLNNTKSILNIAPQGYTWEEFQAVLDLSYTMEHYFGMLDFEERDGRIGDGVVEEGMDGGSLLLLDLQSVLKKDKEEGWEDSAREVFSRYSLEVVRSVRNQIWSELERNTLVKEFNSQERYNESLLRFPSSEIASVMAIIVNKSRYGGKNDERVKNELFERISKYFFVEGGNMFLKKARIDWKEKVVFPFKSSLIARYEELQRMFVSKYERLMNSRNRIQNSNVLLSTLESCKISEMHVYETYWNAMRIVHENISNYKGEIERLRSYMGVMEGKKRNITRLLLKEEELYASLLVELDSWNVKKNSLRHHLSDLRIKEEFAGFTWDLFTVNKFQTVIVLNSSCNNQSDLVKVRVAIEWNMDEGGDCLLAAVGGGSSPVTLRIGLLQEEVGEEVGSSRYGDLQLRLALVNSQRLEDKIYQAYIDIIERTLNLRLLDLCMDFRRQGRMSNSVLIELIRGIFQSCIVLLWRLESIVFEMLNVIKVFNLAIIDIVGENALVLNIPVLVGVSESAKRVGLERSGNMSSSTYVSSSSPVSPLLFGGVGGGVASTSSPLTPSSFASNNSGGQHSSSPHLLMASRPVISIQFNMTNSLFKSVGTLVNSIEDISIYNTSEEITRDMIRVFRDQVEEVVGGGDSMKKKNSAVYVGYNCLLLIIQNTIQEGGRNQLIWKRPLERFAPRLLNAVQISKLHQNF